MRTKLIMVLMPILFILVLGNSRGYAAENYEEAVSYWKFDDLSCDDDFSGTSVNSDRWSLSQNNGATAQINNGQVQHSYGASGTSTSVSQITQQSFSGDFDVQVDFSYPGFSGTSLYSRFWAVTPDYSKYFVLERSTNSTYQTYSTGWVSQGSQASSDTTGKMRLTREGSTLNSYRWTGSDWSQVGSWLGFTDDVAFRVHSFNYDSNPGYDMRYDNFQVTNGESVSDSNGINSGVINGATQTSGQYGNALSFDGSSDYISLDNSVLQKQYADQFSASFWIKHDPTDITHDIISNVNQASSPYNGLTVHMRPTSSVAGFWLAQEFTNDGIWVEGSTALDDGLWHHVVVTYDGSVSANGVSIYVDGETEFLSILQNNPSGLISYTEQSWIGGSGDSDAPYLIDGQLDDIGIWSRALDAYEITAIYDMGIEKFEALSTSVNNGWGLDLTTEEISQLARLYADGKDGLDPEAVVAGDNSWTYLSGDLPGDFGGTTYDIGDSWIYEGKYYIKLGSGLEGGAVPEMPPYAGQFLLLAFGSLSFFASTKKKRA